MKACNLIKVLACVLVGIGCARADGQMGGCPVVGENALMEGFLGQVGPQFHVVNINFDPNDMSKYRVTCDYISTVNPVGPSDVTRVGIVSIKMQGPWLHSGTKYQCNASVNECLFQIN